jgi:type II secretory pathway component HofQ
MTKIRFWVVGTALAIASIVAVGGPSERTTVLAAGQATTPAALRQFSGTPIDVDYQGANLRAVLRQLSEIGGINLVIDPSVPTGASVDLKLTQVPWDQVMDVVCGQRLTNQLGNRLRVLTREARTRNHDESTERAVSQLRTCRRRACA